MLLHLIINDSKKVFIFKYESYYHLNRFEIRRTFFSNFLTYLLYLNWNRLFFDKEWLYEKFE